MFHGLGAFIGAPILAWMFIEFWREESPAFALFVALLVAMRFAWR